MDGRAWSLAYAALDPFILAFDYDPRITLPADEAFRQRRGNCLAFSSLFVAMAREAGLNAWFQEVKIPPNWSSVNDNMLVSKHVNAVIQDRGKAYTVDVSRRDRESFEVTRRISDSEAQAQFYNNRGADALINDDLPRAYAYFKRALEADTQLPFIWSNLGVVYRRNEQIDDALMAYHTALRIDPDQPVALNNLFIYYEDEGDLESAETYRRRVERNRRKNPYYLHYLAEIANFEQRYEEAIPLLNRAISIEQEDYRFHYTLAQSQYQAGENQLARASLNRALELAPDDLAGNALVLPGVNRDPRED